MSLSNALVYADSIVGQITTATNINSLNNALKTGISKDPRETQLVSFLSNGQDPLTVLDVEAHTLGVLFILWALIWTRHFTHLPRCRSARVKVLGALHHHPGKWSRISVAASTQNKRDTPQIVESSELNWSSFLLLITNIPRILVTKLAKGIHRLAEHFGNVCQHSLFAFRAF